MIEVLACAYLVGAAAGLHFNIRLIGLASLVMVICAGIFALSPSTEASHAALSTCYTALVFQLGFFSSVLLGAFGMIEKNDDPKAIPVKPASVSDNL